MKKRHAVEVTPILYTRWSDKDVDGLKPCYLMRERRASKLDPLTEYKADAYGHVYDNKERPLTASALVDVGV